MVSVAMTVLPVWRSPMISSRWPRPMGIMESMALMPVCSGTLTHLRSMMPGALRSMGRSSFDVDGALAVNGLAEGIDDAADEGLADRNGHDAARALDKAALADADVRAEHDDADAALLEVQRHAERAVLEAEQLVGFAFIQPVHLGDAVADLNDVADLILLRLGCIIFDLILDDLTDIVDSEIHGFTNLIF